MIDDLWYKNAVFYCLSVGTYMDANGDGIGDFKGLLRRLDYLHGLDITAIWLMPFQPSPGKDDGYDIADYYGVLRGAQREGFALSRLVCLVRSARGRPQPRRRTRPAQARARTLWLSLLPGRRARLSAQAPRYRHGCSGQGRASGVRGMCWYHCSLHTSSLRTHGRRRFMTRRPMTRQPHR